ncbi:MAG TPA: sigma 54-interacting transcriptional regulator [Kofleriaceae bacterium]|nr:sigma 54-interacting transcriptional regulator [Kofleriaceae bacterium]
MTTKRYGEDVPTEPVPEADGGGGLVLYVALGDRMVIHALPARGHVTIGRREASAIHVDDPSVSRDHAILHLGARLAVEDLGSGNGTRVAGRAIPPRRRHPLALGEPLVLGGVPAVVLTAAGTERAAPAGGDAAEVAAAAPVPAVAGGPIVRDPAMIELHALARKVAAGDISVLVLGETGAGKEIIAEVIHAASPRRDHPLLRINCGAFTESLLESELFGHEKGAFSGAHQAKLGLLETADGGTVFLDELGEMPPVIQAKLLRVIEERKVRRVGAVTARDLDVRFIAATNRDLESEIERGAFRRDLFYRLAAVTLTVPPLRERPAELIALAEHLLARTAARHGHGAPRLTADARAALAAHTWPGNIRELVNVIERAVIVAGGADEIRREHLPAWDRPASAPPAAAAAPAATPAPAEDDERTRIVRALEQCAGSQTAAARLLGISRGTLIARIREYGLPRPRARRAPR